MGCRLLSWVLLCALAAAAGAARAQTFSWINAAGGTFGTAANWSPLGPPSTSAHTAAFNLSSSYTVSLGANHTIGTLNTNTSQFFLTFNMLGRSLSPVSRTEINNSVVNVTGGGTFGAAANVTTLRNSVLSVGTGSLYRAGPLTIGLAAAFASGGTFTAATLTTQGTTVGEEAFGHLSLNQGSTGTFTSLEVGKPGFAGGGRVGVLSNSTLNVGTIDLGVQGTLVNNSSLTVGNGAWVTMFPNSPLTIGGSSVEFVFALPPFPSTINRGGILTINNSGVILGTGGTFATSNAQTLVNYGGLIDIQVGTFLANGNVICTGFMTNAASGNFIAPVTQTTVIDGSFSGPTSGSMTLGIAPGLACYGRMTAGTLIIGSATTSNGWAVVSTPSITIDRAVIVGGAGMGRLDAGLMTSPGLVIGQSATSNGVVNVGTYSIGTLGVATLSSGTMNVTANTTIGSGGSGTLRIEASSLFTTIGSSTIGSGGGSDGTLILFGTGTGTMLPARFEAPANRLTVGQNGRGTLSIGGNSSLNVATLIVGQSPLTGVGSGTVLHSGGTVSVGSLLAVNPSGFYSMSGGTLLAAINNSGTFTYAGGMFTQPISNSGTAIIDGPLPEGAVVNNNPGGKLSSSIGLFAGNGTINNAGSFGGAATVAAGMTLHNAGTISSAGGDFVIDSGATFTNAAGSLIRNGQLSTLRVRSFLDNAGNVEVNAGGGVETAFALNILNAQKLTMKGGLLAVGNEITGNNLSIFPGATVVGFGQINASMYNLGSTLFNGPTQLVGLLENDAALEVRNATTIVYGPANNDGSITVQNGTIVFEQGFALSRGPDGSAGGGAIAGTGTTAVQPGGRLVADAVRQAALSLIGTAAAPAFVEFRPAATGGRTSVVEQLSIAGFPGNYAGQVDLTDNALVIDYPAGEDPPLLSTLGYLSTGYAGGAWTGRGIASSSAAGTPGRAVGLAVASEVFASFPATFAGEQVDATSLLLRYTLYGDANLDRAVGLGDFALLAANFNQQSYWSRGDFNYDLTTGIGDFALLAANFNQALPTAQTARGAAVPEPSTGLLLLAVGAATTIGCGRRRHTIVRTSA